MFAGIGIVVLIVMVFGGFTLAGGKMGPILANRGYAALAIESHRSGWGGHETAMLDDDVTDIDGWIDFLTGRGFSRIVLAGASMGSLSIGRYQSIRQHPNVVALAHLPRENSAA